MTVRSFPFAFQDEAPEDDYYRLHRESGVLSGLNLTLSGLNWSISPGDMFVGGSMLVVENTPATGLSEATTGSNPRRDMLVARRTLSASPAARSTTVLVLKQGTPAVTPASPGLTRQLTGVWEEPLFDWRVPGGGTSAITDVRDLRASILRDGSLSVAGPAALGTVAASIGDHVFDTATSRLLIRRGAGWVKQDGPTEVLYDNANQGGSGQVGPGQSAFVTNADPTCPIAADTGFIDYLAWIGSTASNIGTMDIYWNGALITRKIFNAGTSGVPVKVSRPVETRVGSNAFAVGLNNTTGGGALFVAFSTLNITF